MEYPPNISAWIIGATDEPFASCVCRMPPERYGLDFQGNARFLVMCACRIPPEFTASIKGQRGFLALLSVKTDSAIK